MGSFFTSNNYLFHICERKSNFYFLFYLAKLLFISSRKYMGNIFKKYTHNVSPKFIYKKRKANVQDIALHYCCVRSLKTTNSFLSTTICPDINIPFHHRPPKKKRSHPLSIQTAISIKSIKINLLYFCMFIFREFFQNLHPGISSLSINRKRARLCTLQCHCNAHKYPFIVPSVKRFPIFLIIGN